jgi:hypothetical protein
VVRGRRWLACTCCGSAALQPGRSDGASLLLPGALAPASSWRLGGAAAAGSTFRIATFVVKCVQAWLPIIRQLSSPARAAPPAPPRKPLLAATWHHANELPPSEPQIRRRPVDDRCAGTPASSRSAAGALPPHTACTGCGPSTRGYAAWPTSRRCRAPYRTAQTSSHGGFNPRTPTIPRSHLP